MSIGKKIKYGNTFTTLIFQLTCHFIPLKKKKKYEIKYILFYNVLQYNYFHISSSRSPVSFGMDIMNSSVEKKKKN